MESDNKVEEVPSSTKEPRVSLADQVCGDILQTAERSVQYQRQEEVKGISEYLHKRHPKGIRARATGHQLYDAGIDCAMRGLRDIAMPIARISISVWVGKIRRRMLVINSFVLAVGFGVGYLV